MSLNKLSLAALALVFSAVNFVPAESAQAEDRYAAIAYSQQTGAWGFSYGYNSQFEAESMAKAYAGDPTAQPRVYVKNGYAALALGDDKASYGWGWASTPEQAKLNALQACSRYTTNVYIVVCVHSKYGEQ